MSWLSFVSTLAVALVSGAVGAGLTYMLGVRRDVAVKRRETILPNMILALEELEEANTSRSDSNIKKLENVIRRIQMVGSPTLVKAAHQIVADITNNKHANTTELYFALRDEVRRELKLPPLPKTYMGLNITILDRKKNSSEPSEIA